MSRYLCLALSALLLGLGSANMRADDQEPIAIAGRALTAWQKDLDSDDLLVREEAIEVLASAGAKAKDAVPALKKLLDHENRTLRARAAIALWKIGSEPKTVIGVLGDSLKNASPLARREAALAIGQMGPAAAAAVPGLIELLDDADYVAKANAQNALYRLDRIALPALLTALKSKEVRLRRNAASQIVMLPFSIDKDDLTALEAALKDDDARVRGDVARTLWAKGKSDKPVIDALTAAVTNGDETTRTNIINSIQSSTERPKTLIPLLETAMKLAPLHAKSLAARLLYEIEKKPDRVLPLYLDLLKDNNRYSWSNVILALGDLGPEAKPALARLVEMMKRQDFYNTYEIRQTMPRLGEAAVAPMIDLLKDTTSTGTYAPPQENAIYILAQMGGKALESVTPLLDDKQTIVRVRAVRVLGLALPPPKTSVAKLTELLGDKEAMIQEQAAIALGNIGSDAEKAIPKLAELAKDKDSRMPRLAALRALMRIPTPAKVLTPLALEGLKTNDAVLKIASLEALHAADPKHEELLDKVRELMKDNATRYGAMQVLGRMGEHAAKAVPDLIKQLDDQNTYNRRTAVEALSQLGPTAKEAGPALANQLTSTDQSLQAAALGALLRIEPDPKPIVPKLVAFVEEPKNRASYLLGSAINVLGKFGPKGSDAGPALLAILKEQTQPAYNRSSAGLALAQVDSALAKKEGLELLRSLHKSDPNNFVSVRAILVADPKDKDAIATLENGLKSTNQYTRSSAVQVVAMMGTAGKPFVEQLRPLSKDTYYYNRAWSAMALYRVTGDAKEALPTLEAMLENTREQYARGYSAFTLGEMGAAAKPAWKALVTLRRDQDQYVRQQVEIALKKIDPAEAAKLGIR